MSKCCSPTSSNLWIRSQTSFLHIQFWSKPGLHSGHSLRWKPWLTGKMRHSCLTPLPQNSLALQSTFFPTYSSSTTTLRHIKTYQPYTSSTEILHHKSIQIPISNIKSFFFNKKKLPIQVAQRAVTTSSQGTSSVLRVHLLGRQPGPIWAAQTSRLERLSSPVPPSKSKRPQEVIGMSRIGAFCSFWMKSHDLYWLFYTIIVGFLDCWSPYEVFCFFFAAACSNEGSGARQKECLLA